MTSIELYNYPLPDSLVAQRPAAHRDESRLMTLDRGSGKIIHSGFGSFPTFLRDGDTLVINVTKVFPARLKAVRCSGGRLEVLLVRPRDDNQWDVMIRNMAKLRRGETINIAGLEAEFTKRLDDGLGRVRFRPGADVIRAAQDHGVVPLPPYIKRPGGKTDDDDRVRYQTVFAKQTGSCAAPTAGLHFTEKILETISAMGVNMAEIVLHVGPGTFRPVKSANVEDHVMDAEHFEVTDHAAQIINSAKQDRRRVIAVGSTVVRTLESVSDEDGQIKAGAGATSLYITPGYRFRVVDAMLTNFHLPKSTLLILVSAFAGRELALDAYHEAVREKYRFFSYGDAMFITG